MSRATLSIDLGNAAFEGADLGPELAAVLRDLAGRIEAQTRPYLAGNGNRMRAQDCNGNTVGFLVLSIDAED